MFSADYIKTSLLEMEQFWNPTKNHLYVRKEQKPSTPLVMGISVKELVLHLEVLLRSLAKYLRKAMPGDKIMLINVKSIVSRINVASVISSSVLFGSKPY